MVHRCRWAVNVGRWNPTPEEWKQCTACVQSEETERVSKFVFQRDAQLALAGRLLMRAALVQATGASSGALRLARTQRGRPVLLAGQATAPLDFNVSHQGCFAVFVMDSCPIGVDVMQLTRPCGKDVSDFFFTMRRQFTEREWQRITSAGDESQQLMLFYRHWCLKESFIKAIGDGLAFGLQRLEFVAGILPSTVGSVVTSAELSIDGEVTSDWTFEESLLDSEHCVAVARKCAQLEMCFEEKTVQDLLVHLTPLRKV